MDNKPKTRLPSSNRPIIRSKLAYVSDIAERVVSDDTKKIDISDFRDEASNPEAESRFSRLREAVRAAGGNKSVAARSGVPLSTLGDYIAGGEWKFSAALALAQACNVSLEWLATGVEFKNGETVSTFEEQGGQLFSILRSPHHGAVTSYVAIPRLDVRASAGPGSAVEDEKLIGNIALDEAFLRSNLGRRSENLVSIQASGDSMDPTIRDGDLLIVDTSVTDIQNSQIFVIEVNGRLLVKRIQLRVDGSLLIKSDNPRYETETINPSERNPLRIIGQVVYQAGPVRA